MAVLKMIDCKTCGQGKMRKTTKTSGNISGLAMALIVFMIGVLMIVFIPVLGWVVGGVLCILALFMGGKKQKLWKCGMCGAVVPRL